MAQRPCTQCERPTGLVIDGEPTCASCAAKVPENARFQPELESEETDVFGMPDLPPMPPLPALNVTASRRAASAERAPRSPGRQLPKLLGDCPRCGMGRHYGLCKGQGLVSNIIQNLKPKEAPVTLLKNPNPPAPSSPAPSPSPASPAPDEDFAVVKLGDIPGGANKGRQASPLFAQRYAAILGAPAGSAIRFCCDDLKAAKYLGKQIVMRAKRESLKIRTRSVDRHCYAWIETAGVPA